MHKVIGYNVIFIGILWNLGEAARLGDDHHILKMLRGNQKISDTRKSQRLFKDVEISFKFEGVRLYLVVKSSDL